MKKTLRKHFRLLRDSLSEDMVTTNSVAIQNLITSSPLWSKSQRIMTYVALGNEVQTKNIILQAQKEEKEIVIPVCDQNRIIIPSLLTSFFELAPKTMGILEPPAHLIKKVDPKSIDLCLIPGIVFDWNGNRLGFGAGYYDRFLPALPKSCPKIALAYSFQVYTDNLPVDSHDIRMDYICTEDALYLLKK